MTDPSQALPAWFLAEGSRDSKALLLRGRHFSTEMIEQSSFRNLLEISYKYTTYDDSRLPTEIQYRAINEFEKRTIDAIEETKQGITALIATTDGTVRYLLYVTNVGVCIELLNQRFLEDDAVTLAAGEDNHWSEYKKNVEGIDGFRSAIQLP